MTEDELFSCDFIIIITSGRYKIFWDIIWISIELIPVIISSSYACKNGVVIFIYKSRVLIFISHIEGADFTFFNLKSNESKRFL